jgi:hypothetical protein
LSLLPHHLGTAKLDKFCLDFQAEMMSSLESDDMPNPSLKAASHPFETE